MLIGALVGLALDLIGGGSSVFGLPLLIYGLHMTPHAATTISLAAVSVTALAGAAEGAREKLLELRPGLIFAAAGLVAAPLGVA
jgi:uncharacterized membrane protein YfcA